MSEFAVLDETPRSVFILLTETSFEKPIVGTIIQPLPFPALVILIVVYAPGSPVLDLLTLSKEM